MNVTDSRWPIGVFVSCDAGLGLPLEAVKQIGVPTVQLHAPQPASRTVTNADQLMARLSELRVVPTCMFAGFRGESYEDIPTVQKTVGLTPPATRKERIEELKRVSEFAGMLEIDSIGLHVGFIPHDESSDDFSTLVAAMREVCQFCAGHGQAVHLETGQEPAAVLLKFLQRAEQDNLFVNFDPANMILYGSGEPLEALAEIGPYVRSVHCKDAKWSERPGQSWGTEVPLGEGDVDFPRFLQMLANLGYVGPLTIEREIPQEPQRQRDEIRRAVELLNQLRSRLLRPDF